MHSSSVHNWNSDEGLTHPQKVLWMLLNVVNNSWFPNVRDQHLAVRDFKPDLSEEYWVECHGGTASPSRTLANLFLMQLPWDQIQSELRYINILDVGCGSGNNGTRLQSWSGGRISSYVGADMREHSNWKDVSGRNEGFRFLCADAQDIYSYFPGDTNFIMSQSAIEHLRQDIDFFTEIRAVLDHSVKPVIQVHLLPSAAGLSLYRWHGVRQYTPRTISLFSRMFNDCSYSRLYRLGGPVCNAVHMGFITKPLFAKGLADMHKPRPGPYSDRVRAAIAGDSAGLPAAPSFYALVIHSHAREIIFR
jgi:SAM-dependent methyltransferase